MADEIRHHHEMRHSLNTDTDDLEGAKATYVIEYDHSHDGGEKAHSHAHESTVEPNAMPESKKSAYWWE